MSVKQNIFKNGIASAVQKGVKIAEQLLLVPFFISAWGAAYYGEWLTLTIIPSVLGLSELGFGTATCNYFVLKYASGDKQGAINVAKTGLRIITIMVFCFIILSFITLYILYINNVFDKSIINRNHAIISVSFLLLSRTMGFYMPLYESHYRAARKVSIGLNILNIYALINLTIGILILALKYNIVIYSLSNLIITVIFTIIYSKVAKKILPKTKNLKAEYLKTEAKDIIKKGFGYLLSPIWQAIYFQGTTFVVRIVLGPVAVTLFNTVRTLTRAVTQANTIMSYTLMPELQYEMGAGNLDKARKLFRFGLFTILLIAIVGATSLIIWGPSFYNFWTNNTLNPPRTMWIFFIICILFNGLWGFGSDILIAANRPYDFTIAATTIALITIVFTYFGSKHYGINGAALSSLLLEISLFLFIMPKSFKLIKLPTSYILRDTWQEFTVLIKSTINNKIIKFKTYKKS